MVETLCKVWKSGNTSVITIPVNVLSLYGYEKGDLIQIDWNEAVKKGKMKDVKKEIKSKLKKIGKEVYEAKEDLDVWEKGEEDDELPLFSNGN